MILVLKLVLTPLFIWGASLVGRRWGPAVSGWLVGLPLTSAPVVLFLALEQGAVFASAAAQGTLLGQVSVATFCLTYSWLSFRLSWPCCWLIGWGAFFMVTFLFERISLPLPLVFIGVVGVLLLTQFLLPRQREAAIATKPPAWDIPGRMLASTSFVLLLTSAASILGPHLSGLLTPLPIFATILGIFTHHLQGASAARQLLRGVQVGAFAFSAFFLVVSVAIMPWGIVAAFSLALLAALLTQGCSLWLMRRLSH